MASPVITPGDRRWLSLEEVAETLGLSIHTVRKIRAKGDGPRAVRLGKQLRVHVDDLAAWEHERREASAG
jgi:excisionase family DNA binding protein